MITKTFKRTKHPHKKVVDALLENPLLAIRELNNRSFFEFLKFMWPEVSNEEFQSNWHIEYMCNELQTLAESVADQRQKGWTEPATDLIINVPPGSTKTTTVMIAFPVWCWTRWYWMEFICLSYASKLSLESAEESRDLVRSDRFQAVYPDLSIKADKDQKSNFQVLKTFDKRPGYAASTKKGGSRFSTSIGGSVTGFHAHIILIDDPINPEQAVSPVQLESANRWLDSTMPTRKISKKGSPTVMIMQRLHENDPTGHKLEKKKENVKHICLPGEIRNYEKQVKPAHLKDEYVDELLDPIRMSWAVLEDMEADLGQYGFAGQVGQTPTPPSGGMFKVDELHVIDQMPQSWEIDQVVRYWDKAGTKAKDQSDKKGPAWTVGLKLAKLKSGKWLVLHIVRGRWSSEKREEWIRKTAEADGVDVRIGIEQEPGSGGKESAEATVKNLSGFRVVVDTPKGDKTQRADPFSVQVNWGNVYLLQADWNKEYINEMRFFPFSKFKDQIDASSGAFKMLTDGKRARVMGSRR